MAAFTGGLLLIALMSCVMTSVQTTAASAVAARKDIRILRKALTFGRA